MRSVNGKGGFTLVELLIVVVILGILAAVVIPQFASASQTAVKKSVLRQWQEINNQVELYRTRNGGIMPIYDPVNPMGEGSWGVLVSANYLRQEPVNMYTNSAMLTPGNAETAVAALQTSGMGWYFDSETVPGQLDVHPAGYDRVNDRLSNE